MAQAKESSTDDFLTCPMCLQVLTDPRILPCLHTYCFWCICSHANTARSEGRPVVCPKCQEPLSGDVSSLELNVFSDRIVVMEKYRNNPTPECVPCQLRQKPCTAEMMCLNCGDVLCTVCGRGHRSSSLTVDHQVIPLKDLKQDNYKNALGGLKKIKCPCGKQTDVQFFCQSCSQLACMPCVLIGHKGHKFQEVAEAVGECKSGLTALTEKIRKSVSQISNQETSLSDKLEAIEMEHHKQSRIIEEKAEREIAQIVAKKMKSLNALKLKTTAAARDCSEEKKKLQVKRGTINSCLNVCDTILEEGKDEEVLMLKTIITKRLQQIQNIGKVNGDVDDVHKDVLETTDGTESMKSLKLLNTYQVSSSTDSVDPDMRGLVFNPKFGFVAADKANGCFKLLQEDGVVKSVISYKEFEPSAIAICGNVIACVSIHSLYLFKEHEHNSSSFRLKKVVLHTKKPNTEYKFTYSLTANESQSYFIVGNIPDDTRLHCYGLDGVFRQYINSADTVNLPLSSLSVTSSGCILVCEWKTARVSMLSSEGTVIGNCEPNVKWRPSTVYAAKDGDIFVTDFKGKGSRIFGFDEHGACQLVHRIDVDGLMKTSFLASNHNGNLYVLDRKGKLCVYGIVSPDADCGSVGGH